MSLVSPLTHNEGRGKSKNIFYIYDPLLVILQRHKKAGKYAGNYRTGIYVQFVQKNLVYVCIKTEYCPQLFKNFQENTSTNQILITPRKLFRHKEPVHLAWFSKWLAKKTMKRKHIHGGYFSTLSQIRNEFDLLNHDFINDIGVAMPNTYDSTKASTGARGTHFEFSVVLMSRPDLKKMLAVIRDFETLFLNFYPNSSRTARNDALRSKLIKYYGTSGLKAVCGYNNCSVKGWSNLQAAHILPYIKGGNDDPGSGVFLCHHNHLEQ